VARTWLDRRRCDAALVAGIDVISPFVHAGFAALGAVDPEPTAPFCATRRGLNLGEAAVAFVLVRADAFPDADVVDVVGYGSSCDAHHLTRPDLTGAGLARAMSAALADADLAPTDVDVVSAHATGTTFNDTMEDGAFRRVFGAHRPLVHCAKPVTGHTLGAAGAIDALAMALALERGRLPPTYRRGELDPALAFAPAQDETALARDAVVLSASSGFGGSNAVLVLARSCP
jgi:3-oxoacyl-(acyl-carrier-protein) synthase